MQIPSTTLPNIDVSATATQSPVSYAGNGIIPFAERIILPTIQLSTGSFGNTGNNTITLGDPGIPYGTPRCVMTVDLAPHPSPGMMVLQVYGLTLDQMNQLTIAGLVFDGRQNRLIPQ
jgi:hypothetical protein